MYHAYSKRDYDNTGFQQNLTLKKKQNCRKATTDVDTAYMKQV